MESLTRKELEKHVLKKYDRNAAEIIDSAPLVAVYIFDEVLIKWEKLNCEGILFLYRKLYEPHYNLFLLNRLNNLHLYQPINANLKLQVEESYLLFKNDAGTIFGLWIHDQQVHNRISDEIRRILYNMNLKTFCRISFEEDKNDDISRMLRKAEEEHLKSSYCIKRLRVHKEENNFTSNSVAKFFEDACKVFKNKSALKFPVLQKIPRDQLINGKFLYSPLYNVESIEKHQRYSFDE